MTAHKLGSPMRIVTLCIFLLAINGCSKPEMTEHNVIRPIAWTSVESSQLTQVRTISGIVAPVEATNLSFEVNGKVQSIKVNLGNTVTAGQELARLNQRSFNLSLQSAQAQVEQSQAAMLEAKNEFNRYAELVKQGLVSQSGFDNAKAVYDASKSAVDVKQAELDIAKKNLQDSILLAPYDGIITKRLIEPSQQITTGQSVFEIEGKHGLEVRVMVPETLIQELTQDAIIPVRFPVLEDIKMQGQITEIGTRAESANAFPVTVVLKNENLQLRAGMTAEVDFTFDGKGRTGFSGLSIIVPITALKPGLNQKSYVYVYDINKQVVNKREVQTENILNNQVYISTGLTHGEIIATAGVAFLRDGQSVTLLDKHTQRFN